MIKYILYRDRVISGIVPFSGRSSVVDVKELVHRKQKVLSVMTARALAYGKSVGFIMLRKNREP